ncbi:cell division protein CpoB [Enterobacteriaceae bacterium LUAb1]
MSNFRRHIVALALLVGAAVPWTASAEVPISNAGSGSVEDRVTTLERISNAQAQLLQQLQQQLSDTQNDIDSLRGQIQQNTYQLNQTVERQKQIYQQIDAISNTNNQTTTGKAMPPDSTDVATVPNSSETQAGVVTQSSDANRDYNAAVALVLEKKQYEQAIIAFQAFVKKYPASTYQANANYWLGQLNYNKGKKDDAAYYFATVVKNYPKSPKSAEALYKVGVIMQDKGDNAKAKAVYQQVVKLYPNSESAKLAQKRATGL